MLATKSVEIESRSGLSEGCANFALYTSNPTATAIPIPTAANAASGAGWIRSCGGPFGASTFPRHGKSLIRRIVRWMCSETADEKEWWCPTLKRMKSAAMVIATARNMLWYLADRAAASLTKPHLFSSESHAIKNQHIGRAGCVFTGG